MNDNGDAQAHWGGHWEQEQLSLAIDHTTRNIEASREEEEVMLLIDPKFTEDEQQSKEVPISCALQLYVLCCRVNVRFIKRLKEYVHIALWMSLTNQTGSQSRAGECFRPWPVGGQGCSGTLRRPAKDQPRTKAAGDRHHREEARRLVQSQAVGLQ